MSADYLDSKRSLCILRRLQYSPADKHTLAEFVADEVDASAYDDLRSKAGASRFDNDIKRLRDWGCDIEYYDKEYHLKSYGEFNPVALGETELDALALLMETFAPGAPHSAIVRRLLDRIVDWLPDSQGDSLIARQRRFRLNLRQRDEQAIDARVETAIDKALKEGRLLSFGYRSPSRGDGETVVHTVQPWFYLFDTARGHFYLDAYWLSSRSKTGEMRQQKWQKFRPEHMIAEQIEVLPNKRPPSPPKRPAHKLEYLLSPSITRHGRVTRHFDAMQVHERNAEGWVRVTATTNDLFSAVRLLLTYGDNCRVVGGYEARQEIEKLVDGLARVYGG